MDDRQQRTRRAAAGGMALLFYAAHAAFWTLYGAPANIFWVCHLGALLVAFGWLLPQPALNAIGTLWLGLGNLLWISDLAGGAIFYPTSALTHLGGLAIGLRGVARMGIPRLSWVRASLGLAPAWLLSRCVGDPSQNVNMAFRVYAGWEERFRSYPLFLLLLLVFAALVFLAFEAAITAARRRRRRP